MLRGGHDFGAANIAGAGYIGPGYYRGARDGDTVTNYVYPGIGEPGDADYEPPVLETYAYKSGYVDRYEKNSDAWSIFLQEPNQSTFHDSGMTGGHGGSTVGHGRFKGGWKSIDTLTVSMTSLTGRAQTLTISQKAVLGF
jgi:hypothetical protein